MRDISLVKILPVEPRVPFLSVRKIAAVISILAILFSFYEFFARGLTYGIDFTGGVVTVVDFDAAPPADVQDFVQNAFPGAVVQNISQPAGSEIDHDYLRIGLPLQAEEVDNVLEGETEAEATSEVVSDTTEDRSQQTDAQQVAQAALLTALQDRYGDVRVDATETVSGKVSGELRRKGTIAVLLALGLVLAYIWFRFEWQFGVGAVAALLHDVILTIGVFCIVDLEFNLAIIAAILTIVGYSLNDTVIVYDRIRENLRKYKKMPLEEVINISINDTLSRTILTSLTTLLALTALYFLGGPGLEGFSFAMIWGVVVGTYSSIFVASPMLLVLKLKRGSRIDTPTVPAKA